MRIRSTLFAFLALFAFVALAPGADAAKEKFVRNKPHVNIGTIGKNVDLTGFVALSGLGVETSFEESPGGGRPVPTTTGWSDITLKRGVTSDLTVFDWATEGLRGELTPRDLSVVLLTPSAEPIQRFDLFECFPTRWDVSTDSSDHAVETLVVKCGRVELAR